MTNDRVVQIGLVGIAAYFGWKTTLSLQSGSSARLAKSQPLPTLTPEQRSTYMINVESAASQADKEAAFYGLGFAAALGLAFYLHK